MTRLHAHLQAKARLKAYLKAQELNKFVDAIRERREPAVKEEKSKAEKETNHMAQLTVAKGEYEVLPTADYLAQVVNEDEETGFYGQQLKLTFEIVAPKKYAGKQRVAWCALKLISGSKKSKLLSWAEAIYNRPIMDGEEVDTESLIGRQVVITLVSEARDDGTAYNKVTALKPYNKQDPYPRPESVAGKSTAAAGQDSGEFDDDPFIGE